MDELMKKDIAEQVVKKKRTRPDKVEHVEPGDNRKYIGHSLRLAGLPSVTMSDTEAVRNRIEEYFQICREDDMKPSVSGLALALDIDRRYLWEIREGKKGKNPDVADMLKKAMKVLELQMIDYMQNGQINPVSAIFLTKNHFGYADKQEVIVTPNQPLGDTKDEKQLAERYSDSVIIEGEATEVEDEK